MEILRTVVPVAIAVIGWTGLMIWWFSRINSRVDAFAVELKEHVNEDKEIHKQIQGLLVNEANFGGLLSNLNLEITQIRRDINSGAVGSREMFQLQLDKQSKDLLIMFRDMLHAHKKEIGDEMARTAARIVHDYMRDAKQD